MRIALLVLFLSACGPGATKVVVKESLAPNKQRRDTMEATLRVLDEKPEYVDEFFALARVHPPTLDRFIADTARDLDQQQLAQPTAEQLVRHPDGLHRILVDTMDASHGRPAARRAISTAIRARASTAAAILIDDPEALAAVMRASVDAARKNPEKAKRLRELLKELVAAE